MLSEVERLADSASFARGCDYFQRGRVLRATTHDNGNIDGVVEGEDLYRVSIEVSRGTIRGWRCTCRAATDGTFCKHCVAVAFAAESRATDASGRPTQASPGSSAAASVTKTETASVTNTDAESEPDPPAEALAQVRSRILAMFRTQRELIRWSAVSEYVAMAYLGVDDIRAEAEARGPTAFIPTVQKALASVEKVVGRADDSNGEIGSLAYELLALHAQLCKAAPPKPSPLVDWLITFSFESGFFETDVADYADALGPRGLALYGARLDAVEAELPPPTSEWDSERRMIGRFRERLAVAIGDPAGVMASFGELTRSYRMHDLAKALVEVGAVDEAIEHAERATTHETGWQAESAGHCWCELLHEHRSSEEELAARRLVFDRWPSARNALALEQLAGAEWESLADAVYEKLESQHPRELITTLLELGQVDRAWATAERLTADATLWTMLIAAREKTDPASIVPILIELIDADLETADARNYKSAVKRLKQLRRALTATDAAARFPLIVAELREQHRRRPRLLKELSRAGF